MQAVCGKCKKEMRCIKNDIIVGVRSKQDILHDIPSSIWMGDLYECSTCKAKIIINFGDKASTADPNYASMVKHKIKSNLYYSLN